MCSLIDILQWKKKNQKDSDDFWHRKLTLKVKFWYFLTAPHYSNFQNLVTSFEYSWFLPKNLPNFVSLPWKLHNRECHNKHVKVESNSVKPAVHTTVLLRISSSLRKRMVKVSFCLPLHICIADKKIKFVNLR